MLLFVTTDVLNYATHCKSITRRNYVYILIPCECRMKETPEAFSCLHNTRLLPFLTYSSCNNLNWDAFQTTETLNAQSSLRHSLGDTQSSFNKLYQKKCSSTDEIFTLDDLSLSFQKFPLIPVTLNNMKTKVYLNLLNTFNPLTMKCRLHYLKIQFVPHSKHFSSWL